MDNVHQKPDKSKALTITEDVEPGVEGPVVARKSPRFNSKGELVPAPAELLDGLPDAEADASQQSEWRERLHKMKGPKTQSGRTIVYALDTSKLDELCERILTGINMELEEKYRLAEVRGSIAVLAATFSYPGIKNLKAVVDGYQEEIMCRSAQKESLVAPKGLDDKQMDNYKRLVNETASVFAVQSESMRQDRDEVRRLRYYKSMSQLHALHTKLRCNVEEERGWVRECLQSLGLVRQKQEKWVQKLNDFFIHVMFGKDIDFINMKHKKGSEGDRLRTRTCNVIQDSRFMGTMSEILGEGIWALIDKRKKHP